MKPGYTLTNLLAIPMCLVAATICGTYTNVQMIFLLRNPEYFNVPQDQLGQISNNIIFYAVIASVISVLFIGYAFDILGRKITLFTSTLLSAIFMFFIPFAPAVYPWLYVIRMAIAATYAAPNASPLVADYVKKNSRGKATALYALGFVVGDLITFGVLFNITKNFEIVPGFGLVSTVVVILAFLFLIIVKEPKNRYHSAVRPTDTPQ